jgi:hypothetical protein
MPVAIAPEDEIRAKFLALSRTLQLEAISQLLPGAISLPKPPCACDLTLILRQIESPA